MTKMWGGRFAAKTDPLMERFNASIGFDIRLWRVDIRGSVAWAAALERAGVLTTAERKTLTQGLDRVAEELAACALTPLPSDEDIHTLVERRLRELVGPVAGKLHTGRSRNDQVATDMKLWIAETGQQLRSEIRGLQTAIVSQAEAHVDAIMPGYTHTRQAQPVLFSHWILSYFWMLQRDLGRLDDALRHIAVLPLGSGALAGTAYPVDRVALAMDLGFTSISENSIDAVSDRDFVVEVLAWAALAGVHLSRLAEDLVWWSAPEFGFVELDDAYCTGSSLMPQKRNPDSMELVRGKAGRLIGNLVTMLVALKGTVSGYNKDYQEDKEPLFDTLDTLGAALPLVTAVVRSMRPRPERMQAALDDGLLATDLADYLVERDLPFREAHEQAGRAVASAERLGLALRDLPATELAESIPGMSHAAFAEVMDFCRSVERRSVPGGTALNSVLEQLDKARRILRLP